MRDIIDVMLRVTPERTRSRKSWRDVKLPGDTILPPGVVSRAANAG